MNSATYVKAKKQQKKYPELERKVERLNLMKEMLQDYINDIFLMIMRGAQDCNNLEHAGKPYDYQNEIIEADCRKGLENLMKIFSEFVIKNPFLIVYGSEEHRTLRYCRYGEGSDYRLAIQNQIAFLQELKCELPFSPNLKVKKEEFDGTFTRTTYELKIRKRVDEYTHQLQDFYEEVCKTVPIVLAS